MPFGNQLFSMDLICSSPFWLQEQLQSLKCAQYMSGNFEVLQSIAPFMHFLLAQKIKPLRSHAWCTNSPPPDPISQHNGTLRNSRWDKNLAGKTLWPMWNSAWVDPHARSPSKDRDLSRDSVPVITGSTDDKGLSFPKPQCTHSLWGFSKTLHEWP